MNSAEFELVSSWGQNGRGREKQIAALDWRCYLGLCIEDTEPSVDRTSHRFNNDP